MWLSFYNKDAVGDTLLLTKGDITRSELATESKGNVTRIYREATGETVSMNVFEISKTFTPAGNGQVVLTDEELEQLNALIKTVGFEDEITVDLSPKFVVGYVDRKSVV